MQTVLQELRYALKQLGKNPGYSIVVVLTLALSIGANTAIFSVVDAILLRPLPYPEPQRLGSLMQRISGPGVPPIPSTSIVIAGGIYKICPCRSGCRRQQDRRRESAGGWACPICSWPASLRAIF